MAEPDHLNPCEVLEHLHALGYRCISTEQLKEFIHDLRKLIKYDQKRISRKYGINLDPNDCECSCIQSVDVSEKVSVDGSYVSSCSQCSYTACKCQNNQNDENDENNQNRSNDSNELTDDELGRQNILTRGGFDKDLIQKAQTSFIRPWNLQTYKETLSRAKKKHDPVKLYHQYKDSWNRMKIPGQSNHSQLRWIIRNKMLGQEPQPRVL